MTLHPLAQTFASVADAYDRGRPDYTPEVVQALADELSLAPRARVLDLAAGTGKLTRALLAAELDVVAVEPQPALREILAASIGAEHVHDGLAEEIPFADGSLDAVTVADAFHWFEPVGALREIRRVLRTGGALAVIFSAPDWSGASWAHELGQTILAERPQHPMFDGPPWHESLSETGSWSEPEQTRVATMQPTSVGRVVDHVESMSWVAAMPEQERKRWLEQVRALLDAGDTPPELPVHFTITSTVKL